MPNVIVRRPRTGQPLTDVGVSSNEPLARGLKHFWHWGAAPSVLMRDAVAFGHATVAAGAGLTERANPYPERDGRTADFAQGAGCPYGVVVPGASIYPINGTPEITTLILFNLKASGDLADKETAFWRKSAGTTGIAFDLFPGAAAKIFRPLIHTTGETGWSVSYDVAVGDLAYNQLSAAAVSYVSGSRKTYYGPTPESLTLRHTATAITGVMLVDNAHDMYIGGMEYNVATTVSFPGSILAVLVWDRVLSEQELLAVSSNPWQVLEDEQVPVWFAAGGVILITAADSLTPSFTEVVTLLSRSEISDTLTPSVAETTAVTAGIAVVETLTPSVTEATVITALLTAVDSLTVSLTEAQSSLLSSNVTDTATPSVTELAAVTAALTAVDTLTPSVTETAVLLIALSASDTLTPSLTETQDSLVFSALSDVLAFTLGEVQGSFVSSNLTEIFSVSVTDTSTMLVGVTATDTFLVSITDAAAVVATAIIEVAAADALSPSFTEVATVVMTDTWGRPTAVVSVWSAGSAITGTWPQDGSISKLWVKDPPVL